MAPTGAYLMNLGVTPYAEAVELQQSLAGAVSQGAIPDTIVILEHPPTVTLGRRTGSDELHLPPDVAAEVVETNRGGKSTYHAPGQLVCYPILDLTRHGRDVRKYCRDLEETVIRTLADYGVAAARIDGLTGVWVEEPPRKIASIGVHISRWVTTHGFALNVDLDPAPFTEWITRMRARQRHVHHAEPGARPSRDGGRGSTGSRLGVGRCLYAYSRRDPGRRRAGALEPASS